MRMRRAVEAKLKAEVDDLYLWDDRFNAPFFYLAEFCFITQGFISCYRFVYNTISVGRFAVGDFRSALALSLCAALVLALILSPWVRLSTDGFPSIQPRKEGSIPSMDALVVMSVTNVVSLVTRYIRWLRSSCRMKVVEDDLVDRPEPTPDETLFLLSCKSGDVDTVRALIEAGVNPNAKSKRGTTGLMLAARSHFFDIMVELMQAGAKPAAQSADGTTALILACSRGHGTVHDVRCLDMLLQNLTYDEVNMAKEHGVTALMVAAYFAEYEYVYKLLTYGAEITLESVDHVGPLSLVDPKTRPFKLSFSGDRRSSQEKIWELLLEAQTQPLSLLREATEGDIQLSSGGSVQILYDDELGHGSFGTVYEGRMRGMRVAVKQLLVQDSRNYQRELGALSALGNSERVVKFYGSVRNGNIAYIVMEYCSSSLFEYLHNSDDPLDAELILRWMSQLAEGIQFLHANDLVHRDIKTQNVLVENDQIKIADFGLAKAFRRADSAASMTNYAYAQGTFEYMAPELFDPPSFGLSRGSEYTHKSDVYAFGVVLWECATRQKPYAEVEHVLALAQMVPEGERPQGELRTELPGDYAKLMSQCWHQERRERPSADEIVERLHVMYNEL